MDHELRQSVVTSTIYTANIERAVQTLQEEGCREIYLFGSVATGDAGPGSDSDIGIKDYPRERFFHIDGRLLTEPDTETDSISSHAPPVTVPLSIVVADVELLVD